MKKGLLILLIVAALFTMTGGALADPQSGGDTPYIRMFSEQCLVDIW